MPLLALTHISKRFSGVRALEDVHLELYAGEVTALVGENGAGKSTLVKILTGIHAPDAGEIRIDGAPQTFRSPRDAWAAGITAIHQETVMFDELSVAENIFAGHFPLNARRNIDWARVYADTKALMARLEVDIAPKTPLKRLSVAQKHLVEIARALSHEARIVIMDEPTAALSRHEIDDLFRIIAALKAQGRAILFISHKFDEVFAIADRFAVFRDGASVGDGPLAETSEAELVRLMVGRPVDQVFPKRTAKIGETRIEVEDYSHATEFDGVRFQVRAGEILGFYGLVGAGRSEAMQAIFGLTRKTRGTMLIDGAAVDINSPGDAIAAGLAYVPEDRQSQGAALPLGIRQNATLASLARLTRFGLMSRARELALTRDYGDKLSVKASHWEQRLQELSGGNQQKVVLAKWLATKPRVLIIDEPTKGIDIGSKAAVHEFIGELAAEGLAVILVSSELPEILGMSDRIIVMAAGRIQAEFLRADATPERLVRAAAGEMAA